MFFEFGDAHFSSGEEGEELESAWVTKSAEDGCCSSAEVPIEEWFRGASVGFLFASARCFGGFFGFCVFVFFGNHRKPFCGWGGNRLFDGYRQLDS